MSLLYVTLFAENQQLHGPDPALLISNTVPDVLPA